MERTGRVRKPVFGVGAPKTNETSIGITSPARGRQGVPGASGVVMRRRLFEAAEQRAPASPVRRVA